MTTAHFEARTLCLLLVKALSNTALSFTLTLSTIASSCGTTSISLSTHSLLTSVHLAHTHTSAYTYQTQLASHSATVPSCIFVSLLAWLGS